MKTFIDLFAGIGGFRVALEELGCKCVAFSEIEKTAIETYKENFDTTGEIELGDISKVDHLPHVDLIVGGVPCQPWSTAGNQKGFEDERGQLWFDVIKLVEKSKPNYFIFENVKSLKNARNKGSLDLLCKMFSDLGYTVHVDVLKSSNFGTPQIRERVFLVGVLGDQDFSFSYGKPNELKLSSFLPRLTSSNEIPAKPTYRIFSDIRKSDNYIQTWHLYDTTDREKTICRQMQDLLKEGKKENQPKSAIEIGRYCGTFIATEEFDNLIAKKILEKNSEGLYRFKNKSTGNFAIEGISRIVFPNATEISTLTKTERSIVLALEEYSDTQLTKEFVVKEIIGKKRYRKLTAEDYRILQGFPETFKMHPKPSKAKQHFGNAVTPSVIKSIAETLLR